MSNASARLTYMTVPGEIIDAILKIFQDDTPSSTELTNIHLVCKRARATVRRRLHLFLETEDQILQFLVDIQAFSATFPFFVFCDVEVLQIPMPNRILGAELCRVLPRIFIHLTPSLCHLSIIFGENSATGVDFMRILRRWSSSLQDMKVLKLCYNYSEDENEVLRYFVQILALYDLLSRQVI